MKIYKDIGTKDELISDAFMPQHPPFGNAAFSEVAFEVRARLITKGEEDFGITRNTEEGEEEAGGGGGGKEQVIDVLDNFKLTNMPLGKKEFRASIKELMTKVMENLKAKNPDRVDVFKKAFMPFFQECEKRFADLDFYFGPESLSGGVPVISYYEGEETAPRFIFITDALEVEKV